MNAFQIIQEDGIVPVAVIKDASKAVGTAEALLAGGLRCIEVTLRTPDALQSIEKIASQDKGVLVGAGTVTCLEDEKRCIEHGARFIVSPGFDEKMASWSKENEIPYIPGCVTPTEIMAAIRYEHRVLKFFPAAVYGGLKAIQALAAPFPDVRFVPTGGVGPANLGEYLGSPHVFAVGGSWICPKNAISEGNFSAITDLCKEAVATLRCGDEEASTIQCGDEAAPTSQCGDEAAPTMRDRAEKKAEW